MNVNDTITVYNLKPQKMTVKELAAVIKDAAANFAKNQHAGCHHWNIGKINKHDFAICLGWDDGFDNDPNDNYAAKDISAFGDSCHICMKLGFQPDNSIMQCDYDCDWLMPYDETSGDVDDTNEAVYADTDYEELVLHLLNRFYEYTHNDNDDFIRRFKAQLACS